MKKFLPSIILLLVLGCSFAILHTTIMTGNHELNASAEEGHIVHAEGVQAAEKTFNGVALSAKKPQAASTTITGGLAPIGSMVLTYSPSFLENQQESFVVEKEGNSTYLSNPESPIYPELSNFTYIEDDTELMVGVSNSDFIFLSVSYPLEEGKYTKDKIEEQDVFVESTTATAEVKAGTFDHVAVFRYPDGAKVYIAPGVGIIKATDGKGKTTMELVSVEEK